MLRGDTTKIRVMNANLLRESMLASDVWTKDSLAAATRLSPATCRNILADMLASGEVREVSLAAPQGGRPARRFRYNRNFIRFLLVEIRRDSEERRMAFRLVDAGGREIQSTEIRCRMVDAAALPGHIAAFNGKNQAPGGIVVSYPGVVLNGRTDRWGDIEELEGLDLAGDLRRRLGLPVFVENDINVAAWGYGLRRSEPSGNLAYIGFPEGMLPGCGLLVDGALLRGSRGFAGEVNYIRNQPLAEQLRDMGRRHGVGGMVLQIIRPIVALLDPAEIVVAGPGVSTKERDYIQRKCQTMVRREFLPKLVFQDALRPDAHRGMVDIARRLVYGDDPAMKLVL